MRRTITTQNPRARVPVCWRTWPLSGLLLLAAGQAGAAPQKPPAAAAASGNWRYVLPPNSADVLRQALSRATPPLRLDGMQTTDGRAQAKICQAQLCATYLLGHFRARCQDLVVAPWCVKRLGGGLSPAADEALRGVLAKAPVATLFRRVGVRQAPPPADARPGRRSDTRDRLAAPVDSSALNSAWMDGSDWLAYTAALLFLLAPLVLGFFPAWFLRRRWGWVAHERRSQLLLGLCPVVLYTLFMPWTGLAPYWDWAPTFGLFGLALWRGSVPDRLPRRQLLLATVSSLLTLLALELGSRWLLPPPPRFPPPRVLAKNVGSNTRADTATWGVLFPDHYSSFFKRRSGGGKTPGCRVLHVGDSITEGLGVAVAKRFTRLLEQRDPDCSHLNLGVPGSAADFHYLAIRRWVAKLSPSRVVYHLNHDNDIADIGRSIPACNDQPLLHFGASGPQPRCGSPHWGQSLDHRRFRGPPHILLRVATGFSVTARHVCGLLWRLGRPDRNRTASQNWPHFESIMAALGRELRSQSVPLLVALVPPRLRSAATGWQRKEFDALPQRVLDLCRRQGLSCVDAIAPFTRLTHEHGEPHLFLEDQPRDPHFNSHGHQVYADWLWPHLQR